MTWLCSFSCRSPIGFSLLSLLDVFPKIHSLIGPKKLLVGVKFLLDLRFISLHSYEKLLSNDWDRFIEPYRASLRRLHCIECLSFKTHYSLTSLEFTKYPIKALVLQHKIVISCPPAILQMIS